MDISGVKNYFMLNISKDVLKSMNQSEGIEFELLYQCLIDELSSKTENYSNVTKDTYDETTSSSTISKMSLDDIPILIKNKEVLDFINIPSESTDTLSDSCNDTAKGDENLSSSNIKNINSSLTIDDILSKVDEWTNYYEPAEGETLSYIYNTVGKYSNMYGVDENLVLAIIKQESNFDVNTVSHAGAMGLMQLMDFNCETFDVSNPLDIDQNIRGGVQHIKEYIDMFNGDIEMALMAYNGGPGNMERRGVTSPEDIYKMPLETQNYVPKVMNYYKNGFVL